MFVTTGEEILTKIIREMADGARIEGHRVEVTPAQWLAFRESLVAAIGENRMGVVQMIQGHREDDPSFVGSYVGFEFFVVPAVTP